MGQSNRDNCIAMIVGRSSLTVHQWRLQVRVFRVCMCVFNWVIQSSNCTLNPKSCKVLPGFIRRLKVLFARDIVV